MGKVIANSVILKNQKDVHLQEEGYLKDSDVRSVHLDMIVDSGARTVSLPMNIIEQLGLSPHREVTVTLANGHQEKRTLYRNLHLQINDRDSVFECLGKPKGAPSLLGQLVLETLDYVVDCPNQRLIPNPEAPPGQILYEDYGNTHT